jgi:hypothetical protein
MANYYSNQYHRSAQLPTNYGYNGARGTNEGQVVSVSGTLTVDAALATNDVGYLFDIPAGAKLTAFQYYNDDLGGTCTASVRVGTTDCKTSIALGTAVALGSTASLTTAECAAGHAGNASAASTVNISFTSVATPSAGAVTWTAQYVMP